MTTISDLMKSFIKRNTDVPVHISDIRPSDEPFKIQVWFKNGSTLYAKWNRSEDLFELSEVNDGGYTEWK